MNKDFDTWNKLKVSIHHSIQSKRLFRKGDVWWCSLGANIGFEEDGKNGLFERPVVVIKKFHKEALLIVPFTTSLKESPYNMPITINGVPRVAIISQIRLISPKRLQRRMGYISMNDLSKLKIAIRSMV